MIECEEFGYVTLSGCGIIISFNYFIRFILPWHIILSYNLRNYYCNLFVKEKKKKNSKTVAFLLHEI